MMNRQIDELRIVRLHKSWADRYIILWQIFILMLFLGMYFIFDQSGVDAVDRASALVLLAAMVLAAAIWQAVGLGIARVHMLMNGIDLERPTRRDAP